MSNRRKGLRKCCLPRRPNCSPLPNPSPYGRTLGPRTPDRHLTKNTTSLYSAYLRGTGAPIRTPEYPSITELHTPGRLVLRLLACPLASPDRSSWETSDTIPTLEYRKVWQSSCKDKPPNGIHMRDWVNKYLVYQPIATVSYPAMVHRIGLPGIGPS